MRILLIIAFIAFCGGSAYSETNTVAAVHSANEPVFRISGELRAIQILGKQELAIPWRKPYSLGVVVQDLGGFTEWASHIIVTETNGVSKTHYLGAGYKNYEKIKNIKIDPGMIIVVKPTYD